MYGYITPDKSKLYQKDFLLFRAFYCGVCKTCSKSHGTLPRLSTNYDIAFLSVFLHSYLNVLPEFCKQNCILNPFKKKDIVKTSLLMQDIMNLNILLTYHNIQDKIIDGDGFKNCIYSSVFKRAYNTAVKIFPEIDKTIIDNYQDLRALENQNCQSIDRVSHCFADMLSKCIKLIIKKHNGDYENTHLMNFLYNLGKYVYLMDALDDLKSDYKSNNYNPFLTHFGGFTDKTKFIEKNKTDIDFIINMTINQIIENFNQLTITEGRDLLQNIIYYGFRHKVNLVKTARNKTKSEKI